MRVYQGVGNKVFNADLHDQILAEPDKHAYEAALVLCDNRWSYCHTPWVEEQIVKAVQNKEVMEQLVDGVIKILNGENGDHRVGAAELLGEITPPGLYEKVIPQLEKRLNDSYVRDYIYGGYPGDEEDMRTVGGCAKESVKKLREIGDKNVTVSV